MLVYIQFPSFLYEFNENHEYSSSPVTAWMAKIGPSIQFSARKIELKFKKFIRKHKRIFHILGLSATPCVYLVSLPPIQFNPIQSNPNGRKLIERPLSISWDFGRCCAAQGRGTGERGAELNWIITNEISCFVVVPSTRPHPRPSLTSQRKHSRSTPLPL